MFGHRAFFVIGGDSPADIKSLINGGYEVLDSNFSFQQAIDRTGKATTRVYSGTFINLTRQINAHTGTNTVLRISPEKIKINDVEHDNFWVK